MFIPKNHDPSPTEVKQNNISNEDRARHAQYAAVPVNRLFNMLWNNAGSGKILSVDRITCSSAHPVGSRFLGGVTNDKTGFTDVSLGRVKSFKNNIEQVNPAQLWTLDTPSQPAGTIDFVLVSAAPQRNDIVSLLSSVSTVIFEPKHPIVLEEGYGLYLGSNPAAQYVHTFFEYEEIPVIV